jgi:predicted dehydrogenase
MSERLRVAVLGAGRLGSIHARVMAGLAGAELAAVADTDPERARLLAEKHGAPACAGVHDLPAGIDAAIVATPTRFHFEVAGALLERGVHVLVEKPICATVDEARRLCAIAEQARRVLMVGHSERFNPVILALGRYELEPRFVEAQRVSPFSFRSSDIGVVLDMMIHDIDIILHLVKSPVETVDAAGVAVIGAHEDLANARLRFANGAVANATASRVALKTERTIRIFSREMYVTLDYQNKVGRVIRKGPGLEAKPGNLGEEVLRGITNPLEYMTRDLVRIEDIPMSDVEPLVAEDEEFLRAIREQRAPAVTGEDGKAALETANRIVESLNESLAKGGAAPAT